MDEHLKPAPEQSRWRLQNTPRLFASLGCITLSIFMANFAIAQNEPASQGGPLLFPAYEGVSTKLPFRKLLGAEGGGQLDEFEAVSDAGRAELAREHSVLNEPFAPGDRVILDGTASIDIGAHAITCSWRQAGGKSIVELETADQCVASFVAPSAFDTLAFELEVSDGEWRVKDTLWVEIVPEDGSKPTHTQFDTMEEGGAYQVCLKAHETSVDTHEIDTELPRVVQQKVIELAKAEAAVIDVCRDLEERRKSSPSADNLVLQLGSDLVSMCEILAEPMGHTAAVLLVFEDDRKGVKGFSSVEAGLAEARAGDLVYVRDPRATPIPEGTLVPEGVHLKAAPQEGQNSGHVPERSGLRVVEHVFPPAALTGKSLATQGGTEVRLSGSQSYSLGGQNLSYQWRQVQGTAVSLSCDDCPQPTFVAPSVKEDQKLVFELVVDNGFFESAPSYVEVDINGIPVGVERALWSTDFSTGPEGWQWWGDSGLKPIRPSDGRMKVPARINRKRLGISRVFRLSEFVESGWNRKDPLVFAFDYQAIATGGSVINGTAPRNFRAHALIGVYDAKTKEQLFQGRAMGGEINDTGRQRHSIDLSSIVEDGTVEELEIVLYRYMTPHINLRLDWRQTLYVDSTRFFSVDGREWNPPPVARALLKRSRQDLGTNSYIQVTQADDGLWYTPPENFSGNDRFRIWTCAGEDCAPTYVSVFVSSTDDDKPVAICPQVLGALGGDRRVELSAKESFDPEGRTLSYTWVQTEGRPVALKDATPASDEPVAWFSAPKWLSDEQLTFQLTVYDQKGGKGRSSTCTASVMVHAQDGATPDFVVDPDDVSALASIQDGLNQAGTAYEETKNRQVVLVKGHHVLPIPSVPNRERCLLNVPDGVILRGLGQNKTILEPSAPDHAVLCVRGSDVTVQGLTVRGLGNGTGIKIPHGEVLRRTRRYVWGDTNGWVTFVTTKKPSRILFQQNRIVGHRFGIGISGNVRDRLNLRYAQDINIRANEVSSNEVAIATRDVRGLRIQNNRLFHNDLAVDVFNYWYRRGVFEIRDNQFNNATNIQTLVTIPRTRFRKRVRKARHFRAGDRAYLDNGFGQLSNSQKTNVSGPLFGVDPISMPVNQAAPVRCWMDAPQDHKILLIVTKAPSHGHLWVGEKRIKDVPYEVPVEAWDAAMDEGGLRYEPLTNYSGTRDTFRLLALDHTTGGYTERTVVPQVRDPKAKQRSKTLNIEMGAQSEEDALVIDAKLVLSDIDNNAKQSPLTYRLATAPRCGEVTILGGGLLRYQSTCSVSKDQFTIEADDGEASTALTIYITPEGAKSSGTEAVSSEPLPTSSEPPVRSLVNVHPELRMGGYTVRLPSTPDAGVEVVPSGTKYVAADGTGDYLTLAEAMSKAVDGTTLFLAPGRHALPQRLTRSSLRLLGTKGTILTGPVSIFGNNLTFEDLEIEGSIHMDATYTEYTSYQKQNRKSRRRTKTTHYRSTTVPRARNVHFKNVVVRGDVRLPKAGRVRELGRHPRYQQYVVKKPTRPHPVVFLEGMNIFGRLIVPSPEWVWQSGNQIESQTNKAEGPVLATLSSLSVTEDVPHTVLLLGENSKANPLDYYLTSLPAYGHFLLDGTLISATELSSFSGFLEIYPFGNVLTYVPPQNLSGEDVDGFSYAVKSRDGMPPSAENTVSSVVSITIQPVNDSPIVADAKAVRMETIGAQVAMQGGPEDESKAEIVKEAIPGTSVLWDLSRYFHDPEGEDCYAIEVESPETDEGARVWAAGAKVFYHAPQTGFETDHISMSVRDCDLAPEAPEEALASTPFTLTVHPKSERDARSFAVRMSTPQETALRFGLSEAEARFDGQAHALGEGAVVFEEPGAFDFLVDDDGPGLFSDLPSALVYASKIDATYREQHGVRITVAPGVYPLAEDGKTLSSDLPPGVSIVCREALIRGTLKTVDLWPAKIAGCLFENGGIHATRYQWTSRHGARKGRVIYRAQTFTGNLWVMSNAFGPESSLVVDLVKMKERRYDGPYYDEMHAWYLAGAPGGRGYQSHNNLRRSELALTTSSSTSADTVKLMSAPSSGRLTREDGTELNVGDTLPPSASLTYMPERGFLGADQFWCGRSGSGLSPVAVHVDVTPRYTDLAAKPFRVQTIRNQPILIDVLRHITAPKGAKLEIVNEDSWTSLRGGQLSVSQDSDKLVMYAPKEDYHADELVVEPKAFLDEDFDLNVGAWNLGKTGHLETQNGLGVLSGTFHQNTPPPVMSQRVELAHRKPNSPLLFEIGVKDSTPRISVTILDADTGTRLLSEDVVRESTTTFDLTDLVKDTTAISVQIHLKQWWAVSWRSNWSVRNRRATGSTSFDFIKVTGEIEIPYKEKSDEFLYTVRDQSGRTVTGRVIVDVAEGAKVRDTRLIAEAKAEAAKARELATNGFFAREEAVLFWDNMKAPAEWNDYEEILPPLEGDTLERQADYFSQYATYWDENKGATITAKGYRARGGIQRTVSLDAWKGGPLELRAKLVYVTATKNDPGIANLYAQFLDPSNPDAEAPVLTLRKTPTSHNRPATFSGDVSSYIPEGAKTILLRLFIEDLWYQDHRQRATIQLLGLVLPEGFAPETQPTDLAAANRLPTLEAIEGVVGYVDGETVVNVLELGKATDAEGSSLRLVRVDETSLNGATVHIEDRTGQIRIVASDYVGVDQLTYTVEDEVEGQVTGTLFFETKHAEGVRPEAKPQLTQTQVSQSVKIRLQGRDKDGDPLSYEVQKPRYGTVALEGAVATYTPDPFFVGPDTFVFRAYDGTRFSEWTPVTILVNELLAPGLASRSDLWHAMLTRWTTEALRLEPASGEMLSLSSAPAVPEAKSFQVYAVEDTERSIQVVGYDPDWMETDDALLDFDIHLSGEQILNTFRPQMNAYQPMRYYIVSPPQHGTLEWDDDAHDNIFVYRPHPNYTGNDSFVYVAHNHRSTSRPAVVTIRVLSENDAPTLALASEAQANASEAQSEADIAEDRRNTWASENRVLISSDDEEEKTRVERQTPVFDANIELPSFFDITSFVESQKNSQTVLEPQTLTKVGYLAEPSQSIYAPYTTMKDAALTPPLVLRRDADGTVAVRRPIGKYVVEVRAQDEALANGTTRLVGTESVSIFEKGEKDDNLIAEVSEDQEGQVVITRIEEGQGEEQARLEVLSFLRSDSGQARIETLKKSIYALKDHSQEGARPLIARMGDFLYEEDHTGRTTHAPVDSDSDGVEDQMVYSTVSSGFTHSGDVHTKTFRAYDASKQTVGAFLWAENDDGTIDIFNRVPAGKDQGEDVLVASRYGRDAVLEMSASGPQLTEDAYALSRTAHTLVTGDNGDVSLGRPLSTVVFHKEPFLPPASVVFYQGAQAFTVEFDYELSIHGSLQVTKRTVEITARPGGTPVTYTIPVGMSSLSNVQVAHEPWAEDAYLRPENLLNDLVANHIEPYYRLGRGKWTQKAYFVDADDGRWIPAKSIESATMVDTTTWSPQKGTASISTLPPMPLDLMRQQHLLVAGATEEEPKTKGALVGEYFVSQRDTSQVIKWWLEPTEDHAEDDRPAWAQMVKVYGKTDGYQDAGIRRAQIVTDRTKLGTMFRKRRKDSSSKKCSDGAPNLTNYQEPIAIACDPVAKDYREKCVDSEPEVEKSSQCFDTMKIRYTKENICRMYQKSPAQNYNGSFSWVIDYYGNIECSGSNHKTCMTQANGHNGRNQVCFSRALSGVKVEYAEVASDWLPFGMNKSKYHRPRPADTHIIRTKTMGDVDQIIKRAIASRSIPDGYGHSEAVVEMLQKDMKDKPTTEDQSSVKEEASTTETGLDVIHIYAAEGEETPIRVLVNKPQVNTKAQEEAVLMRLFQTSYPKSVKRGFRVQDNSGLILDEIYALDAAGRDPRIEQLVVHSAKADQEEAYRNRLSSRYGLPKEAIFFERFENATKLELEFDAGENAEGEALAEAIAVEEVYRNGVLAEVRLQGNMTPSERRQKTKLLRTLDAYRSVTVTAPDELGDCSSREATTLFGWDFKEYCSPDIHWVSVVEITIDNRGRLSDKDRASYSDLVSRLKRYSRAKIVIVDGSEAAKDWSEEVKQAFQTAVIAAEEGTPFEGLGTSGFNARVIKIRQQTASLKSLLENLRQSDRAPYLEAFLALEGAVKTLDLTWNRAQQLRDVEPFSLSSDEALKGATDALTAKLGQTHTHLETAEALYQGIIQEPELRALLQLPDIENEEDKNHVAQEKHGEGLSFTFVPDPFDRTRGKIQVTESTGYLLGEAHVIVPEKSRYQGANIQDLVHILGIEPSARLGCPAGLWLKEAPPLSFIQRLARLHGKEYLHYEVVRTAATGSCPDAHVLVAGTEVPGQPGHFSTEFEVPEGNKAYLRGHLHFLETAAVFPTPQDIKNIVVRKEASSCIYPSEGQYQYCYCVPGSSCAEGEDDLTLWKTAYPSSQWFSDDANKIYWWGTDAFAEEQTGSDGAPTGGEDLIYFQKGPKTRAEIVIRGVSTQVDIPALYFVDHLFETKRYKVTISDHPDHGDTLPVPRYSSWLKSRLRDGKTVETVNESSALTWYIDAKTKDVDQVNAYALRLDRDEFVRELSKYDGQLTAKVIMAFEDQESLEVYHRELWVRFDPNDPIRIDPPSRVVKLDSESVDFSFTIHNDSGADIEYDARIDAPPVLFDAFGLEIKYILNMVSQTQMRFTVPALGSFTHTMTANKNEFENVYATPSFNVTLHDTWGRSIIHPRYQVSFDMGLPENPMLWGGFSDSSSANASHVGLLADGSVGEDGTIEIKNDTLILEDESLGQSPDFISWWQAVDRDFFDYESLIFLIRGGNENSVGKNVQVRLVEHNGNAWLSNPILVTETEQRVVIGLSADYFSSDGQEAVTNEHYIVSEGFFTRNIRDLAFVFTSPEDENSRVRFETRRVVLSTASVEEVQAAPIFALAPPVVEKVEVPDTIEPEPEPEVLPDDAIVYPDPLLQVHPKTVPWHDIVANRISIDGENKTGNRVIFDVSTKYGLLEINAHDGKAYFSPGATSEIRFEPNMTTLNILEGDEVTEVVYLDSEDPPMHGQVFVRLKLGTTVGRNPDIENKPVVFFNGFASVPECDQACEAWKVSLPKGQEHLEEISAAPQQEANGRRLVFKHPRLSDWAAIYKAFKADLSDFAAISFEVQALRYKAPKANTAGCVNIRLSEEDKDHWASERFRIGADKKRRIYISLKDLKSDGSDGSEDSANFRTRNFDQVAQMAFAFYPNVLENQFDSVEFSIDEIMGHRVPPEEVTTPDCETVQEHPPPSEGEIVVEGSRNPRSSVQALLNSSTTYTDKVTNGVLDQFVSGISWTKGEKTNDGKPIPHWNPGFPFPNRFIQVHEGAASTPKRLIAEIVHQIIHHKAHQGRFHTTPLMCRSGSIRQCPEEPHGDTNRTPKSERQWREFQYGLWIRAEAEAVFNSMLVLHDIYGNNFSLKEILDLSGGDTSHAESVFHSYKAGRDDEERVIRALMEVVQYRREYYGAVLGPRLNERLLDVWGYGTEELPTTSNSALGNPQEAWTRMQARDEYGHFDSTDPRDQDAYWYETIAPAGEGKKRHQYDDFKKTVNNLGLFDSCGTDEITYTPVPCSGAEPKVFKEMEFSGYPLEARQNIPRAKIGPNANYLSSNKENVRIDEDGKLHLNITQDAEYSNIWYAAETILKGDFGYGRYTFVVEADVANWDKNVVLGLFTWDESDDALSHHNREIDIEITRWGKQDRAPIQFAMPPYNPGFIYNFGVSEEEQKRHNQIVTYQFDWAPKSIRFKAYYGDSPSNEIDSWNFLEKEFIQEPGKEEVRINLWLHQTPEDQERNAVRMPASEKPVGVIVHEFRFDPAQ